MIRKIYLFVLFGTLVSGISVAGETLNRGLAVMGTKNGMYLSWRLHEDEDCIFGTSDKNTSFKIYKNGVLLTENEKNTNYLDTFGKRRRS